MSSQISRSATQPNLPAATPWPRASGPRALACFATILGVALAVDAALAAEAAVPAKVLRYAKRLVAQYDRNGDGQLQEEEWRQMHGQPARADVSGDGVIGVDELAQWIAAFGARRRLRLAHPSVASADETDSTDRSDADRQAKPDAGERPVSSAPGEPSQTGGPVPGDPDSKATRRHPRFHVPAKRLPTGLPPWFRQRDADGDGQLILSEFAAKPTAADRQEFARYDLNGDGVVTPQEYLKATGADKRTKASKAAAP